MCFVSIEGEFFVGKINMIIDQGCPEVEKIGRRGGDVF
jgi:hypothetical protein